MKVLLIAATWILPLIFVSCSSTPPPKPSLDLKPSFVTHQVLTNKQSLGTVSKWYTGDKAKWNLLAKANPFIIGYKLKIGDRILIPSELVTNPLPYPYKAQVTPSTKKRKVSKINGKKGKSKALNQRDNSAAAQTQPTVIPTVASTEAALVLPTPEITALVTPETILPTVTTEIPKEAEPTSAPAPNPTAESVQGSTQAAQAETLKTAPTVDPAPNNNTAPEESIDELLEAEQKALDLMKEEINSN